MLHEAIVPVGRDGGQIVTFRGWAGQVGRRITVQPVNVRRRAEDHDAIAKIRDQAEAGLLAYRVADTLPAGQAAEAHRRMDKGGLRGRIILQFED